jgi:hypothetical protein
MATPPSISAEQRQAALARAAEVRRVRSEIKSKLKMGIVSLEDVLDQAETDDDIAGIKVLAILESLPGVGKVRARRLMDEVKIAETRRLRGLGATQRERLLQELGG